MADAWVNSDPIAIKAADRWFEQLHPLTETCMSLLKISSGVKPEKKSVLKVLDPNVEPLPKDVSLEELTVNGRPLCRLEFEKSARFERSSGKETVRIGLTWNAPRLDGTAVAATRNIRVSCSKDLSDRQLTVEVPNFAMFNHRRWSAYHGFVMFNVDSYRHDILSEPPEFSPEQLAVTAYSCVEMIWITIECLTTLRDQLQGRHREFDEHDEMLFLRHL